MNNPIFIKVGNCFINPAQIRLVTINKTDVDIYFNGIPGCKTVSLGNAEPLIALLNSRCS